MGTKKTAYEIWNGKKPRVKDFRVFGSKCYILNDWENLGKFDAKMMCGNFLQSLKMFMSSALNGYSKTRPIKMKR